MWKKLDQFTYENTVTGAYISKMFVKNGYAPCLYESVKAYRSLQNVFHPFKNMNEAKAAGECPDRLAELFKKQAA